MFANKFYIEEDERRENGKRENMLKKIQNPVIFGNQFKICNIFFT